MPLCRYPLLSKCAKSNCIKRNRAKGNCIKRNRGKISLTLLWLAAQPGLAGPAGADMLSALDVMRQVNQRPESPQLTRHIQLDLTNANGQVITRQVRVHKRQEGADSYSLLAYLAPKNIRGTAVLTHDNATAEDDQWLYLPAMRRVRRISAAARGDQFLGTDFSYEDIKKENKIELADFQFSFSAGQLAATSVAAAGDKYFIVQGVPKSEAIAEELGYSKVEWQVDAQWWLPRQIRFWDTNSNLLKTIHNQDVRLVGGIPIVHETVATNLLSGHSTRLLVQAVDVMQPLPSRLFTPAALRSLP